MFWATRGMYADKHALYPSSRHHPATFECERRAHGKFINYCIVVLVKYQKGEEEAAPGKEKGVPSGNRKRIVK